MRMSKPFQRTASSPFSIHFTALALLAACVYAAAGGARAAAQTAVGSATGTLSATLTITAAGTLSAINVLTQGAPNLDFNYVSGGTCTVGNLYAVNATCTVLYTFAPLAPGLRMGAVVLVSGSTVLSTSYVSGTATGPLAVVSPGTISTVAGNGTAGNTGDNGQAMSAELHNPYSVAVDGAGNLYIADSANDTIRKVTAAGVISTVAGTGTAGFSGENGPATSAQLNTPDGVTVDGAGNLYIADFYNNRIRMVTAAGIISTVAGNGTAGFSGDSMAATSAELDNPYDVAVDRAGNLYISDRTNNRIRKVTTDGAISTLAGTGTAGYSTGSGQAISAELNGPGSIAVDAAGNLYIADVLNERIRKVTAAGAISTVAGNGTYGFAGDNGAATGAELYNPYGVTVDGAGNLFIADSYNQRIRKVTAAGVISTVAGNGTLGFSGDSGPATGAEMDYPYGVTVDAAGNLYIADRSNQRIRKVTATAALLTFASTAVGAASAQQVVTLSNNGNTTALSLTSLAAGSLNANISGAGTTCSTSSTLAAGATCNLGVVFAPTAVGTPATGSAVVTDNSLNSSSAT